MVWPTLGSRTAKSLEQNSHKIFVVGTFSAPSRAIPGFDSAHWPPTSFATETAQCRCVAGRMHAAYVTLLPRVSAYSLHCSRTTEGYVSRGARSPVAETERILSACCAAGDLPNRQRLTSSTLASSTSPTRRPQRSRVDQSTYARLVSVSSWNPHDVTPARPGARLAKFHYTGPTGPARTFLRSGSPRNSVGSVRVSEKVRSGPVGPV